ncbi:MAG: hypothetical protein GY909_05465 [Oligoflexia bacterium]|nr:hypothetical protein [Oligoflexia bacterium]
MIESIFLKDDSFIKLSLPVKAIAFYKNKSLNLISNKWSKQGIEELNSLQRNTDLFNNDDRYIVAHFCYEYGASFLDHIDEDSLLGVWLEFSHSEEWSPDEVESQLELLDAPLEKNYNKAFQKGYDHLLKGDCYQFNLTFPFKFKTNLKCFEEVANSLFLKRKNLGEFAMVTNLGPIGVLASNSPECLFKISEDHIETRPIKGTRRVSHFENEEAAWEDLKNSSKDQAELYMISDLLRNDLNKLSPYVKVANKKVRLDVPELIHQYSEIILPREKVSNLNLFQMMEALFPGGSITGAPKKRVFQILKKIEEEKRGFYCGSTFLNYKNTKQCSINIRTSFINLEDGLLSYHAGGGITVKSNWESEYLEMISKVKSFVSAFSHGPIDQIKASNLNKNTNNFGHLSI